MPDVITPLLQFLEMATGTHDSDWGANLNINFSKIEAAICGTGTVDLTGGNHTLTDDEARPYFLSFIGTPSVSPTVTVAARPKRWFMFNQTNQVLLVKVAGGAQSFTLPIGASSNVLCDGANLTTGGDTLLGEIKEYAGIELPTAAYAWANGQALSRAANAALFNVLTHTTSATGNQGQFTVNVNEDITGKGLAGCKVEAAGVPSGTIITAITSGTITFSNALTSAMAGTAVIIFPWGNGDGLNTFNLPDLRQRTGFARGDMGGLSDPGRITTASVTYPTGLGQLSGSDQVTLTTAQMPAHVHGVTDPGHVHGITDPGHSHSYIRYGFGQAVQSGSGVTVLAGSSSLGTSPATTGISINTVTTGISIQSTGGGGAHGNMPPFYLCNKIIRVV